MAGTKKWGCPHCDATNTRWDLENFNPRGYPQPTTYCESCHKAVDNIKVMQGKYDRMPGEGCLKVVSAIIALVIMATLFMWFMGAFG